MSREEIVNEILNRYGEVAVPSKELLGGALLREKPRLKVYLGVDPTGPSMHLGHLTNLLVLKKIQALGHQIIFLIGDFTGRIGDPTGKMTARRRLKPNEIEKNMKTFAGQAERIISFNGKNCAEIEHNSKWLKDMRLDFFITYLLGAFSVQNLFVRETYAARITGEKGATVHGMLERKDFFERLLKGEPLLLQEFVYPLLQGYDGAKMDVDIEVGGNDQTFNMSIGRALRESWRERTEEPRTIDRDKFFITTRLLINPKTGQKLMNKSEGGNINLDDLPEDIFGKIMARPDASMFEFARLCTEMPLDRIRDLEKQISGGLNPREAKVEVAREVVKTIYGEKAAQEAETKFQKLFSKKETPEDLPELKLRAGMMALDVAIASGVVKSKSEARRLIEQGGFEIDGEQKKTPTEVLSLQGGEVIRIGKKKFFRANI